MNFSTGPRKPWGKCALLGQFPPKNTEFYPQDTYKTLFFLNYRYLCKLSRVFRGCLKIDVTDFEWISESADDPQDLCLHGKVTAQIGDEVITDHGTVSSTALSLLRTLTEDHNIGEDNQMIPCCGHFMIANEDLTHVDIIGCPFGTDWNVEQIPGGVKITTDSGTRTCVPIDDYRREVYRFADQVEDYYNRSKPKQPFDDFQRKGYTAFWNEWHRRRSE